MNNDTQKVATSQQDKNSGEGESHFTGTTITQIPAWVGMPGPWAHIEASWDKGGPKKRRR